MELSPKTRALLKQAVEALKLEEEISFTLSSLSDKGDFGEVQTGTKTVTDKNHVCRWWDTDHFVVRNETVEHRMTRSKVPYYQGDPKPPDVVTDKILDSVDVNFTEAQELAELTNAYPNMSPEGKARIETFARKFVESETSTAPVQRRRDENSDEDEDEEEKEETEEDEEDEDELVPSLKEFRDLEARVKDLEHPEEAEGEDEEQEFWTVEENRNIARSVVIWAATPKGKRLLKLGRCPACDKKCGNLFNLQEHFDKEHAEEEEEAEN